MSAEVWAALEGLLDQGPEGAAQADELAVTLCGKPLHLLSWPAQRRSWGWRLSVVRFATRDEAWPLMLRQPFSEDMARSIDRIRKYGPHKTRLITPAEAAILAPITPRIADAARLATRGYRPQPGDVLRAYLPSNHPLRSLSPD